MTPTTDIAIRFSDCMTSWFRVLARINGRRFGCEAGPDVSPNQLSDMIYWLGAMVDVIEGKATHASLEWWMDGEDVGYSIWTIADITPHSAMLTVSDAPLNDRYDAPKIRLAPALIDLPLFIRRFWGAFRDWQQQSQWTGRIAPIAAEYAWRKARHQRLYESGFYDRQIARHGHSLGVPDQERWSKIEYRWSRCIHLDPAGYDSPRLDRWCASRGSAGSPRTA